MKEFNLCAFANDNYYILTILCDNQVKVKDDFYVTLSQQEIADIAHFSKLKTNRILNDLINCGFVELYQGKRGKYRITEIGHKAIYLIQRNYV